MDRSRTDERLTAPNESGGANRALPVWFAYVVPPLLALFVVAAVWEVWIQVRDVPIYLVPAPSDVIRGLVEDPFLFVREGAVTLSEALAGFALGSTVALTGAVLMAHSRVLERSLLPLAILVKVTPVVAVAPLFVIWFGFGVMPKILITALITFFPVLVNGITGFRSVDPGAMDFLRSVNASRREIFVTLRIPSSMPYLFSAFRVSIPLAVIGAVVGEWFSADRGLGSVIIVAHSNLDMVTLFGAIVTLAIIGIGLTIAVSLAEKKALFWHESSFLV
ncbi:MAG: ABC transporter permease [SAR202 cluster bacterium]|jgi:NitT/TauT family transport system permease protein|nr:ABC transporter permease [Chloroflexota bacterium]MDP6421558.1 ABC transporter permease [SAR202 cluster bacterium]HAL48182.1 ABC transporter permease [Dehalococcoidia bacterium]MDP6664665.1 ABC transporter permease [SAR202 cluster bacterium]MDP6798473.1 ABC transporter permease [SAR202 cluster bacterium]|tara:strand:+ start:2175 stop:3005 length:831 start_codon:yes stop_codon:yes gene_type:complete